MAASIKVNETSLSTKTGAVRGKPAGSMTPYVVVIIDITASMGEQIQGVKDASGEVLQLLLENSMLRVVVITYTESET